MVVPLLLLLLLLLYRCCCAAQRVLLKFRGSVGWNCQARCVHDDPPTCCRVHDDAPTYIRPHTPTQKHPFRGCREKNTLKYGYVQQFCTMVASKPGVIRDTADAQQQQTAQHSNKKAGREAELHLSTIKRRSSLLETVFSWIIYCCSIQTHNTRMLTHTHTQKDRSWLSQKGKKA